MGRKINELITIWVSSILKAPRLNSLALEAKLMQVTSTATKHANKSFLSRLGSFSSLLSLGCRMASDSMGSGFCWFECFLLFVVVGARNKLGSTLLTIVLTSLKPNTQSVCGFGCTLDEDINTLATIIPSIEILGLITRSRAQQLNHQVNSFLCSSTYITESRLLPNDLIVLRNQGDDHGGQTKHQEGAGEPRRRAREGGEPIQFRIAEFKSNSESRTTLYSN
jgi:hypothetical protein